MKLAFCLFKYYEYGGLEREFMRVAKGFLARGHEIHVFTMGWQGPIPAEFQLHLLAKKGLSNHTRAMNFAKEVQKQLKKIVFDYVIGFNRMPGLDLYFASDLCFVKAFQEKHPFWLRYLPRYRCYQKLEHSVFNPAVQNQILVNTEGVKKDYQSVYQTPENRFMVVPAGIQRLNLTFSQKQQTALTIRQKWGIPTNHQLLLQVGSDFTRKGLDRSLRAIAALTPTQQQKVHFFIIGKGKAPHYNRLIKKLAIIADVRILGILRNDNDVPELMQAADGLIHPAYFETAGVVLLEALCSGLPVIVTANCGYAFHVARANAGIIIPQPFQQEHMNQQLKIFLDTEKTAWQQNALSYAINTDFYSLVDQMVNLAEQHYLKQQSTAPSSGQP